MISSFLSSPFSALPEIGTLDRGTSHPIFVLFVLRVVAHGSYSFTILVLGLVIKHPIFSHLISSGDDLLLFDSLSHTRPVVTYSRLSQRVESVRDVLESLGWRNRNAEGERVKEIVKKFQLKSGLFPGVYPFASSHLISSHLIRTIVYELCTIA